ncbi:Actin cytoskeleton-regulatory complex protein end3, putative isoform 1 [Hibiscus syriacus]|uniref:Actin cytoskeleton-regulatory complex protein end3, putative isoform 1 n=1 Tax=Hibiscus syriacus TaxID=106335 RepID=A0A6A3CZ33_HIBSY|nr:Actin cytoskeleton-regulatory complex protein end3, putative isoform 1 [Hibiscus syriacus]
MFLPSVTSFFPTVGFTNGPPSCRKKAPAKRFSSMAEALSHINGNPMFYLPSRPNPNPPFPLLLPFKSKPFKVTMSCNRSYWASISEDIEAYLKQAIPVREPLVVSEPMHCLTLSARGTPLRLYAWPLVSWSAVFVTKLCRWHPQSTSFLQLRSSMSIFRLPKAIGPTESDDPIQNNSDRILRVIVEITSSIGSQGMIHGQYYRVESHESGNNESNHVQEIERISKKYEGMLYACAAACGAIIGGGSEEEIERMRKYGLYVGTIEGIMNRIGSIDKGLMKSRVEELRNLASNELRGFDEAKVKAILNSVFDSCSSD